MQKPKSTSLIPIFITTALLTKGVRCLKLQAMNGKILLLLSACLVCLSLQTAGCVTDHEGTVSLKIIEFPDGEPIKDSLLLTIHSQGLESQGRIWVFEEEEAGPMMPLDANVKRVNTGDELHQAGYRVTTIGPYARAIPQGWEYWVFHEDYQPDEFLDMHFDRAYAGKKPLQVSLPKALPGNSYSDEKMLDGARKFCDVIDFLPSQDPDAQRLFKLVEAQLRTVKRLGRNPRDRQQASDLLEVIEKNRDKWAAVDRFPQKK